MAEGETHEPIGIAGSGRMAQALGRLLAGRGEPVVAVASRNTNHAREAAQFIGERVRAIPFSQLPCCARRILIAVSDDAVVSVATELAAAGMSGGLALHTAGSLGPEALAPLAAKGVGCAMFHPLQTVPDRERGLSALCGIAFGIGGDGPAVEWAESIARLLGGVPLRINREATAQYHAAAVMASNYVIALVDAAVILMNAAGIGERDALNAIAPLLRASAENALALGARNALTGPIERGDISTVCRHLAALENIAPEVVNLYRAAGAQLVPIARSRGVASAEALRELQKLLGQSGDKAQAKPANPQKGERKYV